MGEEGNRKISRAFRAALPVSLPVMTSYFVIAVSYGLFVNAQGLPGWYAPLMATVIFGGSLEFMAATMLIGVFAPIETFIVALVIQSRHLFYGLSMLTKYDYGGWKKVYSVYALSDESFSVNFLIEPPENIDKPWYYFAVSFLNQSFWILGAAVGGILGSVMPFDTSGFGFMMTALFTVILVDAMLKDKRRIPVIIGIVASFVCLLIFGSQSFLVPSLLLISLLLLTFRKPILKGGRA